MLASDFAGVRGGVKEYYKIDVLIRVAKDSIFIADMHCEIKR